MFFFHHERGKNKNFTFFDRQTCNNYTEGNLLGEEIYLCMICMHIFIYITLSRAITAFACSTETIEEERKQRKNLKKGDSIYGSDTFDWFQWNCGILKWGKLFFMWSGTMGILEEIFCLQSTKCCRWILKSRGQHINEGAKQR